ncbi:MAG: hypothetical protein WA821_14080 [Anaerolineales bacterium]
MPHPKITTNDQLGAAKLVIDASLADAEIKELVGAYGYNDQKLAAGKQLYESANAAVTAQGIAESAQLAASDALAAAKTPAVDAYQSLAKTARATLPASALPGLNLGGRMPQGTNAFCAAAGQLFDAAASLGALAEYGYDAAKLSAERAKISAYEDANRLQETAKSRAVTATREQNAALTALNQWLAQYVKIARVALRAKPDLLKRLGVVSRVGPTAAQRAARQKKTPAASATNTVEGPATEGPAAS